MAMSLQNFFNFEGERPRFGGCLSVNSAMIPPRKKPCFFSVFFIVLGGNPLQNKTLSLNLQNRQGAIYE
jgi:hypothetical protein